MHNLPFDYKKAGQAINFFARKNGGKITKLPVLKLIFFADRYHLRKYGRPITNDEYWAMPLGPVASGVKDMVELDSFSGTERNYAKKYFKSSALCPGEEHPSVESIQPVDETVFSDSDMEALCFVWNRFKGRLNHLVSVTHEYPEWKKHEGALHAGQSRVRMDLMDFLDDPKTDVDLCWKLSDEEKLLRRETLMHLHQVETLWR